MSVELYRASPGKFDSRTLNRKTLSRWTGRKLLICMHFWHVCFPGGLETHDMICVYTCVYVIIIIIVICYTLNFIYYLLYVYTHVYGRHCGQVRAQSLTSLVFSVELRSALRCAMRSRLPSDVSFVDLRVWSFARSLHGFRRLTQRKGQCALGGSALYNICWSSVKALLVKCPAVQWLPEEQIPRSWFLGAPPISLDTSLASYTILSYPILWYTIRYYSMLYYTILYCYCDITAPVRSVSIILIFEFSIWESRIRTNWLWMFLLTRCRISMCQGLGPKKHDEISEIDRRCLAGWYNGRRASLPAPQVRQERERERERDIYL